MTRTRATKHGKHCDKLTAEGGFRLIRPFGGDHNLHRLKAYVKAIGRTPEMVAFSRRVRVQKRFCTRWADARATSAQ